MINGLPAKTPAYVSERARVESFDGKIIATGKTPAVLANAGFYHSGTASFFVNFHILFITN